MSPENSKLNQVGMPPPGRTIHRRRAQLEAEAAADGQGQIGSGNGLLLSIMAFGVVVILGLLLAWLVL